MPRFFIIDIANSGAGQRRAGVTSPGGGAAHAKAAHADRCSYAVFAKVDPEWAETDRFSKIQAQDFHLISRQFGLQYGAPEWACKVCRAIVNGRWALDMPSGGPGAAALFRLLDANRSL